jgi:hypothetical protein
MTEDELEAHAFDLDTLRTQSLLICERVLGPHHKDTLFRLMYRGAAYADDLRYQKCIDLWRRALEIRVQKDSVSLKIINSRTRLSKPSCSLI